jgi:hypothetical protein
MSRIDWREHLVAGLAAFLILAIIFAAGWGYVELQTEQRVSEYYASQDKAHYSKQEEPKLCLSASESSRVKCLAEKVDTQQKWSESRRDLHAQEWMAFWAAWMFITSFLAAIAAIIGLILLRWTWSETRRTADVTRDIGEAQLRPYLIFEGFDIGLDVDAGKLLGAKIRANVRNTGQTPAIQLDAFINVRICGPNDPIPDVEINFGATPPLLTSIGRDARTLAGGVEISRADLTSVANGMSRIYLYTATSYYSFTNRDEVRHTVGTSILRVIYHPEKFEARGGDWGRLEVDKFAQFDTVPDQGRMT